MGTFDKGSPGWEMEKDWFKVMQKYWDPPEIFTEDYWDRFLVDIQNFIRKNRAIDERYVEAMTVPLIRRLERIERERRS